MTSIIFLTLGLSSIAQKNEIKGQWLISESLYACHFGKKSIQAEWNYSFKDYEIKQDTLIVQHKVSEKSELELSSNGVVKEKVIAKPYKTKSQFLISKFTKDSLVLKAIDSTAVDLSFDANGIMYDPSFNNRVKPIRLFRPKLLVRKVEFDSLTLHIQLQAYLALSLTDIFIDSKGHFNIIHKRKPYSKDTTEINQVAGYLSIEKYNDFMNILNASGINLIEKINATSIRMCSHESKYRLKLFNKGKERIIEAEEYELPLPLRNLVRHMEIKIRDK